MATKPNNAKRLSLGSVAYFFLATAAAGCVLPFSHSTPQPATTVGKGNSAFAVRSQIPTVNMLAAGDRQSMVSELPLAPYPTISLEYIYGLNTSLDLELGIDGTMYYFVLPAPSGLWGGLRTNIVDGTKIAVSLAGRVGGIVGFTNDDGKDDLDDGSDNETDVGGVYGQASISAQFNPYGTFKPGISIAAVPAAIFADRRSYFAQVYSVTASLGIAGRRFEFYPFFDVAAVDAQNSSGAEFVLSGGLYIRFSRTKRQSKPPSQIQRQKPPPSGQPPGLTPRAPTYPGAASTRAPRESPAESALASLP